MTIASKFPLAVDRNENVILGGTTLHTAELSVDDSDWTELAVPSGKECKGFMLNSRGGHTFSFSTQDDGSAYITVPTTGLKLDLAADAGDTLGYIQSSNATDTIEILYWY